MVEVTNEAGTVVGNYTGGDALQAALTGVGTTRTDNAKAWSVVAGTGSYGDVLINEPNLTVRAADGAAVSVSGPGAANNTGGGCVDIARGSVTVSGLSCIKPVGRGIEVRPPAAEGGVVLRRVSVSGSAGEGIAVISGAGMLIEDVAVSGAAAKVDGLLLTGLTGAGPYRVQGGSFRANGGDGIDVMGAERVQIVGALAEANGENGIEIDGAGNADIVIDGVTSRANTGAGLLASGGAASVRAVNSTFSRNRGAGVSLGKITAPAIDALRFDGSNSGADVRLSNEARTGGTYTNLVFIDTPITLPGEPRGVFLTSATSSVRKARSRFPARTTSLGRYVRVRDIGAGTSTVRLRFLLTPAELVQVQASAIRVYEDDPVANKKRWQVVPGSGFDPAGFASARLTDRGIASGSDGRYALYAPLAPRNVAPVITGVFPPENSTWAGRDVVVSAAVSDDTVLATGAFSLVIDGRPRTRIELRGGNPVWPLVRLPVGPHTARVVALDPGGRSAERSWAFTVVNRTPQVKRLRSTPRPKAVVRSRGTVRYSILIGEDEAIVRGRVNLKIDGRRVTSFRIRGKRIVGRVTLSRGRHTIQVVYTDLDGAQARRGWRFRTVRP